MQRLDVVPWSIAAMYRLTPGLCVSAATNWWAHHYAHTTPSLSVSSRRYQTYSGLSPRT